MGLRRNIVQKAGVDPDEHSGVEKRYNFIFNSRLGDLLRAPNKSVFAVNFTTTIKIPSECSSVSVGLHSANIVNSVPNITDTLYNTIYIIVDGVGTLITLPEGSYTACDIQTTINEALAAAYPLYDPSPSITLLANSATQKLSIQFNIAGMAIDWGQSTIGYILGFDGTDVEPPSPPGSTEGQIIEADSQARLNWAITNFLILCPELVGDGLPLNNVGLGIIGAVPIVAQPGSLIAYEAQNVLFIQCDQLTGQNISSLSFQLTNERGELIDMTEDYNFTVIIKMVF